MKFDFYHNLNKEERKKYDLMLETNYVLLKCDEWAFEEFDEFGESSISVSWIQSIQSTLKLFGLDPGTYPQGSLSANRHYYEALKNYFGGYYPDDIALNYMRHGLSNLIMLRRDDSGLNPSYLFGSYFKIDKTSGTKEPITYRKVDISLRHSATALWVLLEESRTQLSTPLKKSLICFLKRVNDALSNDEEMVKDNYLPLTIASAINTCNCVLRNKYTVELYDFAQSVKHKCEDVFLSHKCISQDLSGNYYFNFPDEKQSKMAKYEYYLNIFILTQVPEYLYEEKIQSIVKGMIENKITTNHGIGIPIHQLRKFSLRDNPIPDFGTTASVLFLLWYALDKQLGSLSWQEYCKINFKTLLDCCLSIYDEDVCYILRHSENYTKILLMPRYNREAKRQVEIQNYIIALKQAIKNEMEEHKGKLNKYFNKIPAPEGLEHIKIIIEGWQISENWKHQKYWEFKSDEKWIKTGEVLGGILKALSLPG